MDFSNRSYKLELLDDPDIPAKDIHRNLFELAIINQKLGGHQITWEGFSKLAEKNRAMLVCEIGCGGGDNLKAIERRAEGHYTSLTFTGIDLNPACIQMAELQPWKNPATFYISDYKEIHFTRKPDILFASLFCHHFKNEELIFMFRWMHENSRSGFFVNDLHRHPVAYYSIGILTRLFSRSYLVRNDAPLSVLRGFKKKELKSLLNAAGIVNYTIHWRWAFRWLIIVRK